MRSCVILRRDWRSIIYPLNALVNDQLDESERLLAPHPQLTFAKFTGQTPRDQQDHEDRLRASIRKRIQSSEPGLGDDSPELQRRVERELREVMEHEARTPESPAPSCRHPS